MGYTSIAKTIYLDNTYGIITTNNPTNSVGGRPIELTAILASNFKSTDAQTT